MDMFEFTTIIDISLPLDEHTPLYPNNPAMKVIPHVGETSTHSEISLGTHTGTHVDTPLHVFPQRDGLESYGLSQFIGKAIVIDVTTAKEKITIADIAHVSLNQGDRVIFKTTNSERGFAEFYPDYVYLDGDCAEYLARIGVALVGIDALSIKQRGSNDHRSHTALLDKNIVILEGINLKGVEAEEYMLVCLPPRFSHIDGSPVRALLLK